MTIREYIESLNINQSEPFRFLQLDPRIQESWLDLNMETNSKRGRTQIRYILLQIQTILEQYYGAMLNKDMFLEYMDDTDAIQKYKYQFASKMPKIKI